MRRTQEGSRSHRCLRKHTAPGPSERGDLLKALATLPEEEPEEDRELLMLSA